MLFEFRNNKNCCFEVWHYNKEKAIAIAVIDADTEEKLETFTVLDKSADYQIGVATVYDGFIDGDEVNGYKTATEILQDLEIIQKVWNRYLLDVDSNFTPVVSCSINLEILFKYSKKWNYYEYSPFI